MLSCLEKSTVCACKTYYFIFFYSTFASIANALLAWSKKGVKRS